MTQVPSLHPESPQEVVHRKLRKVRPATRIAPPLMPLIDVMFTLLMFFLISGQTRGEGAIPSNLPDILGAGTSRMHLKITPIRIGVHPTGENNVGAYFQIEDTDQQWTSAEGLFGYLAAWAQKEDPGKMTIIIKPYGGVRWEHVVNAFNQAIRAKYKQVGFAPSSAG